jgi:excisionase family DNA binding protein
VENFEKDVIKLLEQILEKIRVFNSPWMSVSDCSIYIRVHSNVLYSLIQNKKIPHYRLGKKILLNKTEIQKWLEQNHRIPTNAEIDSLVSTDILSKSLTTSKSSKSDSGK